MKRDIDFVRELLLAIEDGKKDIDTLSKEDAINKGFQDGRGLPNDEAEKLKGHIKLLEQAGLIEIGFRSVSGNVQINGLTWAGHDFLDTVRDPETWKKTKDGALAAGGWTFDLLKDLAKGLAKKKLEELTGVKL